MKNLRKLALAGVVGALTFAGTLPMFAEGMHPVIVPELHAQVIVAGRPGIAIGWYNGRYWDGGRYWDRRSWYAAHPGWRGGWGPGWHYAPPVVGAPGPVVGWYGGRYYDGHRYWDRRGWYDAHPGWRGGWGPGWHYRP